MLALCIDAVGAEVRQRQGRRSSDRREILRPGGRLLHASAALREQADDPQEDHRAEQTG